MAAIQQMCAGIGLVTSQGLTGALKNITHDQYGILFTIVED
jgi:hypothetical protein